MAWPCAVEVPLRFLRAMTSTISDEEDRVEEDTSDASEGRRCVGRAPREGAVVVSGGTAMDRVGVAEDEEDAVVSGGTAVQCQCRTFL